MYQVIVATCKLNDSNFGIGINTKLPWHFNDDMNHFKNTTSGHFVLMGRKTWDSIDNKPLFNRINIIVSSKSQELNLAKYANYDKIIKNINIEGLNGDMAYNYIHYVDNIMDGYNFYKSCLIKKEYYDKELFVIGGEMIYNQFIQTYPDKLDKLFITMIYESFDCSTYFPMELYKAIPSKIIFDTSTKKDINLINNEYVNYSIKVFKYN